MTVQARRNAITYLLAFCRVDFVRRERGRVSLITLPWSVSRLALNWKASEAREVSHGGQLDGRMGIQNERWFQAITCRDMRVLARLRHGSTCVGVIRLDALVLVVGSIKVEGRPGSPACRFPPAWVLAQAQIDQPRCFQSCGVLNLHLSFSEHLFAMHLTCTRTLPAFSIATCDVTTSVVSLYR